MSASVAVPVLRGEVFDLGELSVWISRGLLHASGLRGDDRGVLLAAEIARQDREQFDLGTGASFIASRYGVLAAIHVGPGPVFALMLPEELTTYASGKGALASEAMRNVDLERWKAGHDAKRVRA
jgi:hypothetical protein